MATEDSKSISFSCIRLRQPIGDFFIASMPYRDLCNITFFDVRRVLRDRRDVEKYLGIQRPLSPKRVRELEKFANTVDASFPTSVIIAVDGRCASYDEKSQIMTLSNWLDPNEDEEPIYFRKIARVLDGQHRLAGLDDGRPDGDFEINVSLFVDIDISEQANIFSTVNLAQTKVNRSLAYDLFELAKARSPQKTCHNIAVALDQNPTSPFHLKIKRLGVATEGRFNETITQATFVQRLLPYISRDAMEDRDLFLRSKKPARPDGEELQFQIFRNLFLDERDLDIAEVLWRYFTAVKERWPVAWSSTEKGLMLNRTNGFKGLMRLLRPAYLRLTEPGGMPDTEAFAGIFEKIPLKDEDFNIDSFKPGTSGESTLFKTLLGHMDHD